LNRDLKFGVVAAVNNEQILADNLAASPLFGRGVPFSGMRDYASAGQAYNAGLDAMDADIVIFAHQDVYLPSRWLEQLQNGIRAIEETDERWAVIGVYGVEPGGRHIGHCWSRGLGRTLGESFSLPRMVGSIDEIVIVLRRSSGLRFDERLPGFHLYGTDIVQAALALDRSAYVVHAPVIHNSNPVRTLAGAYSKAYRYMRRKWRDRLPIATTIVTLTPTGYPLWRHIMRKKLSAVLRPQPARVLRKRGPGRPIAQEVGFE